ncbi:hypothetical protein ASG68_22800 [Rhizobium sp. Leaf453]|nr:hypothetical protein ASG42_24560 [Rhizobium sp. Leaf391]KQU08419.1 hypothetical protein ASG68_22800 [Rhizobium sp. Leaf453]
MELELYILDRGARCRDHGEVGDNLGGAGSVGQGHGFWPASIEERRFVDIDCLAVRLDRLRDRVGRGDGDVHVGSIG